MSLCDMAALEAEIANEKASEQLLPERNAVSDRVDSLYEDIEKGVVRDPMDDLTALEHVRNAFIAIRLHKLTTATDHLLAAIVMLSRD